MNDNNNEIELNFQEKIFKIALFSIPMFAIIAMIALSSNNYLLFFLFMAFCVIADRVSKRAKKKIKKIWDSKNDSPNDL